MFDERGAVWFTSRIRARETRRSARRDRAFRLSEADSHARIPGRQLAMYDPKTKQISMIDTCFGTHHLLFAEDANNTLWTSSGGGGGVVGWLNTKMWDQTHDAEKSQGWTALILDTNGNGKRDAYVEGEQRVATAPSGESLGTSSALNAAPDPDQGQAPQRGVLWPGIGPDGTVWGTVLGFPGGIVRLNPGTEPAGDGSGGILRGAVERSEGAGAGFFAARDGHRQRQRRLGGAGQRAIGQLRPAQVQGPLNGPNATGQHCPEGWTLYPTPGPKFKDVSRVWQRRLALLRSGWISSTRWGWARTLRSSPAIVRFADRAGERQVGDHARALSDGLFRERDGRPHRRSQGRLEGQGRVDHLGHARRRSTAETGKGTTPARWSTSSFGPIRWRNTECFRRGWGRHICRSQRMPPASCSTEQRLARQPVHSLRDFRRGK